MFREDGYFNMTKAAKAYGKNLSHFWTSPDTDSHCNALIESLISKKTESVELAIKSRGRHGGTWGHPKLAVFFARWLDVKFAVWCDAVIDDILKGNATLTITRPEESAILQSANVQTGITKRLRTTHGGVGFNSLQFQ